MRKNIWKLQVRQVYLALPRGSLDECLFHLFEYLGKYHNDEMVDPNEPEIMFAASQKQDWTIYFCTLRRWLGRGMSPNIQVPTEGEICPRFAMIVHAS